MSLKETVDKILKERKLSKTWLATKVGMKLDGLRYALTKHSLKFDEIFMMAQALELPVSTFFPEQKHLYNTSDENNLASDSSNPAYLSNNQKIELKKLRDQVVKLKEDNANLKDQLKDKAHIIALLMAEKK
jgi:hypothetical protein